MLPPKYLQDCSLEAEEIAAELRRQIIDDIVERILARRKMGLNYTLTATDISQIEVLTDAGILMKDIRKDIAQKTGLMTKEVTKAIRDGGYKSAKYDDDIYKAVGLKPSPLKQSPEFIRLVQANAKRTMGTFENYTRTTANASQQLFIKSMDEVYNAVALGAISLSAAYLKVIDQVISEGPYITYPSGRRVSLEAATSMCLRTSITQTAAEITNIRMDEMGIDLVMVSSHLGARPSHQKFQGKVFSRSGKSKRYKALSDPIEQGGAGYGSVTGLCGVNCRHSIFPYVTGKTKNPFERYNEKENLEVYEKSQEQRKLERKIRDKKGQVNSLAKAINQLPEGDPLRIDLEVKYLQKSSSLSSLNKEYYNYCKDNGLKPLQYRLQVAGSGSVQKPKITQEAKEKYKKKLAKVKKNQAKQAAKDPSKINKADFSFLDKAGRRSQEYLSWLDKYKNIMNAGVVFTAVANPALHKYTSNYYDTMNPHLYTGRYDQNKANGIHTTVDDWIDKAHAEMKKFQLTEDTVVRRMVPNIDYITGTGNSLQDVQNAIGKEWFCQNFLSARISQERNRGFGHIALDIYLPKGTRCAYVNEFSCYKDIEYEMLIDMKTRYKIIGGGIRKDERGRDELYMELVVIA